MANPMSIPEPPIEFVNLVGSLTLEDFESAAKGVTELARSHGLVRAGARFLDIGCGCGRVARKLVGEGLASYDGFDRHGPMIKWDRQNISNVLPNFRFTHVDVENVYSSWDDQKGNISASNFVFPYADDSFDSILLSSVFTHMTIDEIAAYLKEIARVLDKNGKVLASVFFPENSPPHHGNYEYSPKQFEEVFTHAGFNADLVFVFVQSWYVLRHATAASEK